MFVNVMLDVDELQYIMGCISKDTMRIANDLFWQQDELQTTFKNLMCDAATAKRSEEKTRNDCVHKPEIHLCEREKKEEKIKDKEKRTDDKTVFIILSV